MTGAADIEHAPSTVTCGRSDRSSREWDSTSFRHPAEADLDTGPEQAHALLRDLRESFAPSYLTLISIIEGFLLALIFELLSEGRSTAGLRDPASVLVFNNVILIVLVWNEYRMGSCMFKWIPSLLDALIPFMVGVFQAALILSTDRPVAWLLWLTAFYAAGMVAFENMYRRSAAEERNGFVLHHNRLFRRLNPVCCLLMAVPLGALAAVHLEAGTRPGMAALIAVSLANLMFLLRGEVNWQLLVRATRRAVDAYPEAAAPISRPGAAAAAGTSPASSAGDLVPRDGGSGSGPPMMGSERDSGDGRRSS